MSLVVRWCVVGSRPVALCLWRVSGKGKDGRRVVPSFAPSGFCLWCLVVFKVWCVVLRIPLSGCLEVFTGFKSCRCLSVVGGAA